MGPTTLASALVAIAGVYVLAGLIFSVFIFVRGISRLDRNAGSTGIGFKLLIFPGIIAFWPLLWWKLKNKPHDS